ncbi:MAG: hypothetical protein EXS59_02900 [Candidatus Taylorbacteria bacterium]|nr:hypothetical protein [Candidatus Taylorbacteria bacterium]
MLISRTTISRFQRKRLGGQGFSNQPRLLENCKLRTEGESLDVLETIESPTEEMLAFWKPKKTEMPFVMMVALAALVGVTITFAMMAFITFFQKM